MSDQAGNKDKLSSVLLAASALTSLHSGSDEESSKSEPTTTTAASTPARPAAIGEASVSDDLLTQKGLKPRLNVPIPKERHIPEHKKPNAALTFPEKLMQMMEYVHEQGKDDPEYCVAWMSDGKSFVVRHPDKFTRDIVPLFFKQTKFSSFTRKLYRWGFRQVNRGTGAMDPIVFGNEHFCKDAKHLMAKMRSITANTTGGGGGGMAKSTPTNEGLCGGELPPQFILPRGAADSAAATRLPQHILQSGLHSLAGTKRKAATDWSVMGPEQKIQLLQQSLDISSRVDDVVAQQPPQMRSVFAANLHRPRTTLADRLRAAHNLPSLKPQVAAVPVAQKSSQSEVAKEVAAMRMRHLEAALGGKVDHLAAGGAAFPLTSALGGHPSFLSAAGRGFPTTNQRSSVDIVNAALDALRNSS